MLRTLPDWYLNAEEKLKKTISDITWKNGIDYSFVSDSKGIEDGTSLILNSLVSIYENVGVEQRKNMQEFMKKLNPRKKDGEKKQEKKERKKRK